jgi:hypothetical protein
LLLLGVLIEHAHLLLMLPVELLVDLVRKIVQKVLGCWNGLMSESRRFDVGVLVMRWQDCLLLLLLYLHGKL